VPGNGDPSSEELAGDRFNVTLVEASYSSGVSLTPSDHTVVPMALSRPGSPRPPSVLGVKRSPPPASPSPPSTPPVIPSSPPPHIGTSGNWIPQDWQDWIASRRLAAGRKMKTFHVTTEDVRTVLRDHEDTELHLQVEAEDMERSLLWQVENAGPPAPSAPPPVVGPPLATGVAVPSDIPAPAAGWTYTGSTPGTKAEHAVCFLNSNIPFQRSLLDSPTFIRLNWLREWDLPPNFVIPPS